MAKNNNLTDFLVDVANAIRAKKGTTAKINPQDFSSEIASIESGGGSAAPSLAMPNDVNFIDYDGTILYSYTRGEFLALRDMPALPEHEGLICQGWNYTIGDAKSYVAGLGMLDIGAMYITDDGNTRLYIRIAAEGRMTVPLYFSQTSANGVTIDWGDGSATQTLSGTGNVNTSHTYSTIGDYIITLKVTSGTLGLGHSLGAASYCVMGSTSYLGRIYCNMLQKVEIGSGVTSIGNSALYGFHSLVSITIPKNVTSINNSAFYYCYSLNSIAVPSGVTSIADNAFYFCYSLASITIPKSVTSIGNGAFYNCSSLNSIAVPSSVTSIADNAFNSCYSLASITIPNYVTSIGNSAFYYCYSLAKITITRSVTSISTNAFYNCYGMAMYDFTQHTSVPTLSGTNAFRNIPSDCIIKVPASLLNSWKAATNWSTYATNIVAG